MKKILAGTLLAVAVATTFAAVQPSFPTPSRQDVDDAVVNAKIDARLRQQLRAALEERIAARQLASR